ncbi:hypothetical protein BGZ63DRAFT_130994 [Mariannaea sp. PMI_226]|nr:hypothetical protein BGZ63DRAFT_130994 [Mariannaea sp. PMI_226]
MRAVSGQRKIPEDEARESSEVFEKGSSAGKQGSLFAPNGKMVARRRRNRNAILCYYVGQTGGRDDCSRGEMQNNGGKKNSMSQVLSQVHILFGKSWVAFTRHSRHNSWGLPPHQFAWRKGVAKKKSYCVTCAQVLEGTSQYSCDAMVEQGIIMWTG